MNIITKLKYIFNKKCYALKVKKTAKKCGNKIYTGGKTFVTKNTIIGNNVIILGGVEIREGAIIQASSVVAKIFYLLQSLETIQRNHLNIAI